MAGSTMEFASTPSQWATTDKAVINNKVNNNHLKNPMQMNYAIEQTGFKPYSRFNNEFPTKDYLNNLENYPISSTSAQLSNLLQQQNAPEQNFYNSLGEDTQNMFVSGGNNNFPNSSQHAQRTPVYVSAFNHMSHSAGSGIPNNHAYLLPLTL